MLLMVSPKAWHMQNGRSIFLVDADGGEAKDYEHGGGSEISLELALGRRDLKSISRRVSVVFGMRVYGGSDCHGSLSNECERYMGFYQAGLSGILTLGHSSPGRS